MNSIFSFSPLLHLPLPLPPPQKLQFQLHHHQHHHHHRRSSSFPSLQTVRCTQQIPEGTIPVMELVEKDYSFLDDPNSIEGEEQSRKFNRIISSGEIKENSRVLVSITSEDFIDRLVESTVPSLLPCELLLVVHDSLLVLAMIKEKYEEVKCWQGEIVHVPEKWVPFDVVFLYCLPALPFQLDQIFAAIAKRSSPGARVVISHPEGKEMVKQQRKEYPDVIMSDLPDRMTLEKVATDHSFEMTEFVDEPGFYLAVLKFNSK